VVFCIKGDEQRFKNKEIPAHHRKHPWIADYQYVILDALFALGKDEDDFHYDALLNHEKFIVESHCEDKHYAKVKVVRKTEKIAKS
jgi:hypothetical protein